MVGLILHVLLGSVGHVLDQYNNSLSSRIVSDFEIQLRVSIRCVASGPLKDGVHCIGLLSRRFLPESPRIP